MRNVCNPSYKKKLFSNKKKRDKLFPKARDSYYYLTSEKLSDKERIKHENNISLFYEFSYDYAIKTKSRFLLGEKSISLSGAYQCYHKKFFKKKRNENFEKIIIDYIKNVFPYNSNRFNGVVGLDDYVKNNIIWYCKEILQGRWEELENFIVKRVIKRFNNEHEFILNYMSATKMGRWEQVENYFLVTLNNHHFDSDDVYLLNYIDNNVRTKWVELENELKKIKIARNPSYESILHFGDVFDIAVTYVQNVIKDEWELIEDWIKKGIKEQYEIDTFYYDHVVRDKIKKLLAEKDNNVLNYQNREDFVETIVKYAKNNHVSEEIKNYLICRSMINDENSKIIRHYFDIDKKFKSRIKEFLSSFDENMTVKELSNSL